MCEELGDDEYMTAYVEEAGKTALCDISSQEKRGCDDRQVSYFHKMFEKGPEEIAKQLERLTAMKDEPMKPDLKKWLMTRIKILRTLSNDAGVSTEL